MKTAIIGIGWVTAKSMGQGKKFTDFSMDERKIPGLSRKDVFDQPFRNFARMDEVSRLGLTAIAFALRDSGLEEWEEKRSFGVFASTVYGCLQTDIDFYNTVIPQGGAYASPNLFAYTLPNCFMGEVAIRFGFSGPSFSILEPSPSKGLVAINMAIDSINWGECETVLAGICDLGCPAELTGTGNGPAGAVFLVIRRNTDNSAGLYGDLRNDEHDNIYHNDKKASNMEELVKKCLRHHRMSVKEMEVTTP